MRKRRRLADKLIIMVCAVLVAVSAFFYAPMEARASSDLNSSVTLDSPTVVSGNDIGHLDVSGSYSNWNYHYYDGYVPLGHINFGSSFDADKVYKVNMYTRLDTHLGVQGMVRAIDIFQPLDELGYKTSDVLLNFRVPDNNTGLGYNFYSDITSDYYFTGEFLNNNDLSLTFVGLVPKSSSQVSTIDVTFNFQYLVYSVEELTDDESEQYQNGYNAGYSAGESAGYGNGYSQGFTDGEASVDTGAIYDEAFQAGKDSVDTQSYYDAGYQAGYQVAYQEGYESGYDEGYQSAMDRIDGWGADTAQYPLLLSGTSEPFDLQFDFIEEGSDEFVYSDYSDVNRYFPDIDFNPNHTYKLDFTYHEFTYDFNTFFTSSFSFWLYWGDSSFPLLVSSKNDITTSVFIPGDRVGNGLRFRCDLGQIESNGSIDTLHYYLNGCYLKLYDMGPSGDTQNHIANQTDKLTNGFNDSKGNSVNNDFSSGLNDFETAEDSLFSTATTGLKDFTFFDFQSVPAMVTGMSFVGSIMSGWFTQAGGASGVGIVLSILFSIMLVAMVLGLYRWYQSKGGKD